MNKRPIPELFPAAPLVIILCVLLGAIFLAFTGKKRLKNGTEPRASRFSCVNNLKQIGLAFKIWAGDHDGRFPFNIGTNEGGTMEFCVRNNDGFDKNAAVHLQVLSNELTTPIILVCPQDSSKKPARDFSNLGAENLTYQLRTGPNINELNSNAILAICPIDGNILYCNGIVVKGDRR